MKLIKAWILNVLPGSIMVLTLLMVTVLNDCSWVAAATTNTARSKWIQENLIRPAPNLVFIVTMNKEMLEKAGKNDHSLTTEQDYGQMDEEALLQERSAHPLQAAVAIALYHRLQSSGEYDRANQLVSQTLGTLLAGLEKEQDNWQFVKEALRIYQAVQQQQKAVKLLENFLEINPENVNALLGLADLETVFANFAAARKHIDTAYRLAPKKTDVYIAEFLYQLHFGLLKLNKIPSPSDTVDSSAAVAFFKKADLEHPDIDAPEMLQHSLEVLQIFYTVLVDNLDRFREKSAFSFALDSGQQKVLTQSQIYFQEVLKQNTPDQNPYLSKLILFMTAILENERKHTEDLYGELAAMAVADNNIHRLMGISDLSMALYPEAITHLNRSIALNDNINDRLMLAGLYAENKQPLLSLQTLLEYKGTLSADFLIHRLGYALLAGKESLAIDMYRRSKTFKALWQNPLFAYYAVIVQVLQGRPEQAETILRSLAKQQQYYENGKEFVHSFASPKSSLTGE